MSSPAAASERIVVGYIPVQPGVAAFERAKAEALLRGARLVVVNTGHHGDNSHPAFASAADLDAIDAELTAAGIDHDVQQPTSARDAADEILRAAAGIDATLIVIGVRHRSPVGKLLMGSTAQRVLLEAACPVLAIKEP